MSVELQEQRVRYVGNGTAKNFPFGFTIEEPSQVQVVRADANGTETTLVLNQDYSVALNSDGTGSVTLAQALPTDYVLALVSNIEIDQERAFYNNTPYYQEQIEGGLDKLTRICQQLHELALRHITVPATSSTKPDELLAEIFTAQRDSIESAASAASSAAAAGASEQGAASYLAQTQQAKTEAVAAIQAQQSASETAVEEAGDAQAVRLEQLASNILVSGTAYNKEATVTLDQPITAGTVVSLPVADGQQMMYRVGASTLRMGFNGTLLFEGEQFEEVGNTGSISTSVKLLFDAEAGDVLNFFVYAQNVTVVVDEASGLSIDDQKRLSAAGIKAVADAAQSSADNALAQAGELVELLDRKVDKANGVMEGPLAFGNVGAVYLDASAASESINIGFNEGVTGRGAIMSLRSPRATDAPGSFWIGARSASAGDKYFAGTTDGWLGWMGQRIVTGADVYAQFFDYTLSGVTLPAGGTWGVFILGRVNSNTWLAGGDWAGGTYVDFGHALENVLVFAVRKA